MKQYLQKTTLRLLLAAFLLSLLPVTAIWGQGTEPSGGGSSVEDPYQISGQANLEWIADQIENHSESFEGKYFKIQSDISLGSVANWTPIGSYAKPFKGSFDGGGYMITDLNVESGAHAGLFGVIEDGMVENLGVKFGTIKSKGTTSIEYGYKPNVGGIAGAITNTTIRNCYTIGNLLDASCSSFSTGIGGGIVGEGAQSTILNCYSVCDIKLVAQYSAYGGGIVGSGSDLTVNNCYSICKIEGQGGPEGGGGEAVAGGIIGRGTGIYGDPPVSVCIKNCLALGKEAFSLTGVNRFYSGRILGNTYNANATLSNNYATPLMSGEWTAIGADQNDGADWSGINCIPSEPDVWASTWDEWNAEDAGSTINTSSLSGTTIVTNLPKLKTVDQAKVINGQSVTSRLPYLGFKLTIIKNGDCTVEVKDATSGTYNTGDYMPIDKEITITANPSVSDQPMSLVVSGNEFTSGNNYTAGNDLLTKGTDLTVEATILHAVTVDDAITNGSIEVKKPDGTSLTPGTNTVGECTVLTLTATPATGYQLKKLTADGNSLSGSTYTVAADVTLSAEFEPIPVAPPVDPEEPTPPTPPTPTIYHTVTLPAVEGATTDPVAGEYEVEAWGSFRFYLTLAEEYNESEPVVTTSRGETITSRSSDGAYIIKYVRQPVEIFIDGIVKNPDPVGNEVIATDIIKAWAAKGNLHISTVTDQTVRVYNLAGLLIKQADIRAGETLWQLPSGIYIVQVAGIRYKIIL